MKQHQGQCDKCRIAWVWSLRILLREQVCACCSGPLARINGLARAENGYTWMNWETYQ